MGWKMVCYSSIKLSKHRENAAYLRSESKSRHFVRAVYHNKNHAITHPVDVAITLAELLHTPVILWTGLL